MSKQSVTLPDSVEFIQTITIDINGQGRGKMFPIEKLSEILDDTQEAPCMIQVLGPRSEIPFSVQEMTDAYFPNKRIVPDLSTLRVAPWSKDSSLAMVFNDIHNIEGDCQWPINLRLLAKNKIKELETMGMKICIGVENEFRLLDKHSKKRWMDRSHFMDQFKHATELLPYARDLRKKLRPAGVAFDSCNFECDPSQIEIPLKAYFGIEGIDKVWLFRETAKHVADDMGLQASFMTIPFAGGVPNGMHINHSLWKETQKGLTNTFWNPSQKEQLSDTGKHWLAGILKHSRALSAFFSPTVNCYRRVRMANWAPDQASWTYESRSVAMRVKTSQDREYANLIENRLPSSACNLYLAIAGMIAAGLDGIRNKLKLHDPGNGPHCERLPRSLSESLDCLKKDTYLVNELGEKFVDWFIKVKRETEVVPLESVDLDNFTEQGLAKEVEKYFAL